MCEGGEPDTSQLSTPDNLRQTLDELQYRPPYNLTRVSSLVDRVASACSDYYLFDPSMSTEPWQQMFFLPIQVEVIKGHLHGNRG